MLIKRVDLADDKATWLAIEEVQKQFPNLSLVVKVVRRRETNDRPD